MKKKEKKRKRSFIWKRAKTCFSALSVFVPVHLTDYFFPPNLMFEKSFKRWQWCRKIWEMSSFHFFSLTPRVLKYKEKFLIRIQWKIFQRGVTAFVIKKKKVEKWKSVKLKAKWVFPVPFYKKEIFTFCENVLKIKIKNFVVILFLKNSIQIKIYRDRNSKDLKRTR